MKQPDWTIGIVNYNSIIYLKWQLKIIFELNDPEDFCMIIVDNSNPNQKEELNHLLKGYIKFKNIDIIYHTPKEESASGQHGEGLNLIKDRATTKYLIVHDPDFFWVKRGYLNILKQYLERDKNNVAIGSPYTHKVGFGDPWFPAAYGCAYKTSELKDVDFSALVNDKARRESFKKYPIEKGFVYSYDVGWQIRKKLSANAFHSFSQRDAYELKTLIGTHSFQAIACEYFYQNETICFHLFRGTFSGVVTIDHKDPKQQIKQQWLQVRDKYGSFFYEYSKLNKVLLYKKKILMIVMFLPYCATKVYHKFLFLYHTKHHNTLGSIIWKIRPAIWKVRLIIWKIRALQKKMLFWFLVYIKKLPFGQKLVNYLKKIVN
jgi:hypothetical protein